MNSRLMTTRHAGHAARQRLARMAWAGHPFWGWTFPSGPRSLKGPAKRVGDAGRHLEVDGQVTPHGLVLVRLEEAGPRTALLELLHDWQAEELSTLVGQPEHLPEDFDLPVDRTVCRAAS